VLPTVSPQILDDPDNAQTEVPPLLVDILFGDAKVEVVPHVEIYIVNVNSKV